MSDLSDYGPSLTLSEAVKNTNVSLRCKKCNKLLAEYITPPYRIKCYRCKTTNYNDNV